MSIATVSPASSLQNMDLIFALTTEAPTLFEGVDIRTPIHDPARRRGDRPFLICSPSKVLAGRLSESLGMGKEKNV
jgi:hypothetical protein